MITFEYTCNVLLFGFLGLSTLEPTKVFIGHWTVKSCQAMVWCTACGGLTVKVHWHGVIMAFHLGLLC